MGGPFREGVAVGYGQIESLRQRYPVAVMCRVLEVSESGYHAWRKRPPCARCQEDARLEAEIQAAHQRTRATCGPERIQADLSDHGVQVGLYRIQRLRKKLGLRCKQKRKIRVTTDSRHNLPVAPNWPRRLPAQFMQLKSRRRPLRFKLKPRVATSASC
jgi:putative transposase